MINSVSSNSAGYSYFVKTMRVAKAEPEKDVDSVVKNQSLPEKQWTPEEMRNAGPLPMGREVPNPGAGDGDPGRAIPPNIGVEYAAGGVDADTPGHAIPPEMGVVIPGPGTSDDMPGRTNPPQMGVEYTTGGAGTDAPGHAIPPEMGVEVPGPGTSDGVPGNAIPPQIGRVVQAPAEYQSILNIRG